MEKIQKYNNVSSDTLGEQHLMSSLREAQNSATINKTKQKTVRKAIKKKKNVAFMLLQESTVLIDTKTNDSNNEVSTVHVTDNGFNNNLSVSVTKTIDIPNTSATESKNMDQTNKDNTSQILKEDTPQTLHMKKKKKNKSGLNSSAEENVQTDVTTINPDNRTLQITDEDHDDVSAKATAPLNETKSITKHENTDDMKIKVTVKRTKYTYSNINYEFHEANHAMIDTFAVSLDFFICNDNRKGYCLVCDTTLQMQTHDVRKYLCGHIRSKKHIHLLSVMIRDDKRCVNDGKFFSKLALAREYIISSDEFVKCLLCDSKNRPCKIKRDEQSLLEHVTDNAHRDAKVSWELPIKNALQYIHNQFQSQYNAKKYRCEFCNYQSPSEFYFVKHLHVPYHMTRLMEIPDHANKFKFFFCYICRTLWFGSVDTSNHHYEQMEHKYRVMYGPEISDLPEQVVHFLAMSGQNADILLGRSNCVCYDETIKRYILYSFETDLAKYIPNIKAYPFGSRISDLGLPESDIDIFLDCNNMYDGKNSSYHQSQSLIATVVQYLSHNKKLWIVHDVILHSRTPIAKVQHIPSGIICDISVTNGLAVENTKIIKCFNHAFPLCRKLILFLKRWLHLSGLLGSHLITSYALTWCVIFYLQTLLVFPSISDLIKLKNRSRSISGWEVGVSYDFRVNGLDHTFEELLLGFFLFYANFKYKKQVVCPLLGQSIRKKAFVKLSDLPKDMAPYVAYMRVTNAQEELPQAFSVSPLCVQDPFDLSHNLTKAINNRELKTFQNTCTASAKILKTTLPNLKSPLMPYFD